MKPLDNTILISAVEISKNNLKSCCNDLGIICGLHHFTDLWARDSFFATFGTNTVGQKTATENTIATFISFQRPDGLIPYRILRSPTTIAKYLGKPEYFRKPRADFRSHQSGGLVLDGGLMLIIAFSEYIKRYKNINYINKNYPRLLKCLNWYRNKFKDGLLKEWFQCDWQDSILKLGNTLYTNILYWRSLNDFSNLGRLINNNDHKIFSDLASKIKNKITIQFWNGKYFSDWFDYQRQDYFASFGNLLAILFDFADREKSLLILEFAQKNCLNSFTLETNYPKYPFWRIPFWNHLGGMADYSNRGCLWLQPGILYALALHKIGKKLEAQNMLIKISKTIIKHNGVFEIYERDGTPVNRYIYKSEYPFAWSSGLFLYASDIILR